MGCEFFKTLPVLTQQGNWNLLTLSQNESRHTNLKFICMIFHRKLWHIVAGAPVWMTGNQKHRIWRLVNLSCWWTWAQRLPAGSELKSKVQLSHTGALKQQKSPWWMFSESSLGCCAQYVSLVFSQVIFKLSAVTSSSTGFPIKSTVCPWFPFLLAHSCSMRPLLKVGQTYSPHSKMTRCPSLSEPSKIFFGFTYFLQGIGISVCYLLFSLVSVLLYWFVT